MEGMILLFLCFFDDVTESGDGLVVVKNLKNDTDTHKKIEELMLELQQKERENRDRHSLVSQFKSDKTSENEPRHTNHHRRDDDRKSKFRGHSQKKHTHYRLAWVNWIKHKKPQVSCAEGKRQTGKHYFLKKNLKKKDHPPQKKLKT